ncbi:MAG: B12-binding domain-containing protein, partial [Thermodesulfobacteriota bacterium]|nr:B12-binding domain-containing protein [Thermodesulfobacteriota bacterium]
MTIAVPDSSSRIFNAEFANLSAVVYKRLELEWHYHQKQDLATDVHRLFQYAVEFGRLLQVVYRHKLFDSLYEEAKWYAVVFETRGSGHDSFAVVLESWIIAIQGIIKPPECNELARPLQTLRHELPLLIARARDSAKTETKKAPSPIVERLIRGDVNGAREIVSSMLGKDRPKHRLIVEVLLPAMVEIGQLWELNQLYIFEEHLATEAIRSLLAGLPVMMEGSLPTSERRALVSCIPGDEHGLIPVALAVYLEIRGWIVKNLGGSLPASQIAHAVIALAPDALFLAFTMLSRLDDALEVIGQVREQSAQCRVIFGGRGAISAQAVLESRGAVVARDFDEGYILASG